MLKNLRVERFKGFNSVELENCGPINVLVGRNNAGKSTVLHALHMAGLATTLRQWDAFQPKLEVKDMFSESGPFMVRMDLTSGQSLSIESNPDHQPNVTPNNPPTEVRTVLIYPDESLTVGRRRHRTPEQTLGAIRAHNYSEDSFMQILFTIKYFGERGEEGFDGSSHQKIIDTIRTHFPELTEIASERDRRDIATLKYRETGNHLDILYAGTGLRRFLDILVKTTVSQAKVLLMDEPEYGLHPFFQRQLLAYLLKIARSGEVQVFLSTHSPVFTGQQDDVTVFRLRHLSGQRSAQRITCDDLSALLDDLGFRPSDLFQYDMCLLVEGPTDAIYFEHVLDTFYREKLAPCMYCVQMYGGSTAEAIGNGGIDVRNITAAQQYLLWIRDRDSAPQDIPSTNATKFKNALGRAQQSCHILARRELEYYFPEFLYRAAQQGDQVREEKAVEILHGCQNEKFREAAKRFGVGVPDGKHLKSLLQKHVTCLEHVPDEIRDLIETNLVKWANKLNGKPEAVPESK